jgi:hypothetical protein
MNNILLQSINIPYSNRNTKVQLKYLHIHRIILHNEGINAGQKNYLCSPIKRFNECVLYYIIICVQIEKILMHSYLSIYIKMNPYFPWSRHHMSTDGRILLIIFVVVFVIIRRRFL